MSRILVVEDEIGLSGAIQEWLQDELYVVTVESDGIAAFKRLEKETFELILLDLMLPGLSGLEVCKKYRDGGGSTPIMILTAKGTLAAKEEGLDSGADDYLTKPFSLRELSARVRALLRRPKTYPESTLTVGDIKLDRKSLKVTKGERTLKLLPKEFILLEVLMRHSGTVLSVEDLIDHAWGSDSEITPDTVRSHVKALRKKIAESDPTAVIKTIHGMGYTIEAQ